MICQGSKVIFLFFLIFFLLSSAFVFACSIEDIGFGQQWTSPPCSDCPIIGSSCIRSGIDSDSSCFCQLGVPAEDWDNVLCGTPAIGLSCSVTKNISTLCTSPGGENSAISCNICKTTGISIDSGLFCGEISPGVPIPYICQSTVNGACPNGCTPCPDPSTYCPAEEMYSCTTLCPTGTKTLCPPNPPTNFNHIANTINSITWSWTAPSGTITKYQLFNAAYDILIADTILSVPFQEQGLSINYLYGRKVKACNDYGCSDFSNTADAYTSIEPVDSIQCTSITTDTIEVTAYSFGGGNFSYLTNGSSGIRFRKTGVDTYQQSRVYSFTGLIPNTNYTLTVGPSKNTEGDESGGATTTICRTSPVLTVPNAPSNLHHTANTNNSIDWAWNASSGATYYNIYSKYYSGGNPYWQLKTNITAIIYHQIDSYIPAYSWWPMGENTMYGLGVSACNINGCSGLSLSDAATSMLPPSAIVCSNITQNSIGIQAGGSFTNLTLGNSAVMFREASGATQNSQVNYWGLLGLTPDTTFTFYVKARNQEGDLTTEFGPTPCSTLAPTIIPYSLRIYGPSSSILKLALIEVDDALLLNRGTIKTKMPWSDTYAAFLVSTSSPNASPVRVMTPTGIKAWRKVP